MGNNVSLEGIRMAKVKHGVAETCGTYRWSWKRETVDIFKVHSATKMLSNYVLAKLIGCSNANILNRLQRRKSQRNWWELDQGNHVRVFKAFGSFFWLAIGVLARKQGSLERSVGAHHLPKKDSAWWNHNQYEMYGPILTASVDHRNIFWFPSLHDAAQTPFCAKRLNPQQMNSEHVRALFFQSF